MFNIPPIGVKDQKNWTFLIFRHYIVSWLSAVGPVVGLKLPLEYGKLCVSWQPFLGVQYWSHSIYRNKNVVCIWSVTNQMCIRMWNMNTCFCWKIVYGYPVYKKCLHLLKQDIFMTKIFELFPFTLLWVSCYWKFFLFFVLLKNSVWFIYKNCLLLNEAF